MTNFERIKNMDIEQMAKYFDGIFDCRFCPIDICDSNGNLCTTRIKHWLESEVEDK